MAPIATAITGGLALAFVLLRVYESGFRKKEFQWADLWAVLAMVSARNLCTRIFVVAQKGDSEGHQGARGSG